MQMQIWHFFHYIRCFYEPFYHSLLSEAFSPEILLHGAYIAEKRHFIRIWMAVRQLKRQHEVFLHSRLPHLGDGSPDPENQRLPRPLTTRLGHHSRIEARPEYFYCPRTLIKGFRHKSPLFTTSVSTSRVIQQFLGANLISNTRFWTYSRMRCSWVYCCCKTNCRI